MRFVSSCRFCTPLLAAMVWAISTDRPAASAEQPNIVLIMADDLGYECIGANGGTSYQTPVLDKLAADCGPGLTFCAHAPGAAMPLQTALKHFRHEFEAGVVFRKGYRFEFAARPADAERSVFGR